MVLSRVPGVLGLVIIQLILQICGAEPLSAQESTVRNSRQPGYFAGNPLTLEIPDAGYLAVNGRVTGPTGRVYASASGRRAPDEGQPWYVFLALPTTLEPGYYRAELIISQPNRQPFRRGRIFKITPRGFPEQILHLTSALTEVRTGNPALRAAESAEMTRILSTADPDAWYWTGTLIEPLESLRTTSPFGARRIYVYDDGSRALSIHTGTDYGAGSGTRIAAPGRGKVVFAGFRQVTGNTIVLEHLPGVFSLYYHLDRIDVVLGQIVEQGHSLGVVGATGLATGAHLHWEVKFGLESADPEYFFARPLLDRGLALSYSTSTFQ